LPPAATIASATAWQPLDLAAGDDHMGTLLGEQLGDGFADAAAGAGNEGDLAVKVEQGGLGHGRVPLVVRSRGHAREWLSGFRTCFRSAAPGSETGS